jgi:uncharacterized protein YjbJ (UPF0337 family)
MGAILKGRWLQVQGRMKRAWAELTDDNALAAEGTADVAAGTVQESYGVAKKGVVKKVSRGIDALASRARKAVRALAG